MNNSDHRLTTSVVVTKNRPQVLESLLESLMAQSVRPDEVGAADNDSTASYAEVFGKYRERLPLKTVVEKTPGIAAARNRGVRESSGEIILFTDDDCVADPHWVENIVRPFYRDPHIGAVGGESAWLNPGSTWIAEHYRADREVVRQ